MDEGPPLDRTLSPDAFYSLYRGALAAESVKRRLKRVYVVLLAGRLGLRPGEILHCHEGWVDWGRGELRVPALDPCACQDCWTRARARQAIGDERALADICCDEQWSPGTEAGPRTIAFGWSERISALLASMFDYFEVLECDRRELARLVSESAEDAEGIDPDGLTPQTLRATGGRFFAEVGFDATSVQRLLGLDDTDAAEAYVSHAGQRTSAAMYRIFGRDAVGPGVPPADPAPRFPIVCDPAPFSREPFTPADYDPEGRRERAKTQAGDRVRNPRPAAVPDDVDYDPEAHRMAGQADPEGGQYSSTAGADVPDVAALRDWITRRDASLRRDSALDAAAGDVAPGIDHSRGSITPGEGPPPEPKQPAAAGDGGRTRGVAADRPGPSVGPGHASAETPGIDDVGPHGGPPVTVEEAVTDPVVASVRTRFAVPGVASGQPVEGRVVLGQDEVLLVRPETGEDLTAVDVEYSRIPLGEIVDVVPDAGTGDLPMDSTIGVACRGIDGHDVAVIELDGQRKWDFWMALFRNALHVSQMQVTHPARVGGRVTDETATPGMLYLDRDSVRLTPLGSDATLVSVDLEAVLHLERTRQDVGGDKQPALAIQQFVEGEAVTSLVGSSSIRTLALFERFVRRDYRERLEKARSLTIPDPEKEVLVALYSAGNRLDLTSVVTREVDELRDIVESLESKGLVTAGALSETELTARGRLVVSDRLEAVNS